MRKKALVYKVGFLFFLCTLGVFTFTARAADFKIQRWEGRVQGTSQVLNAPADFTAVSSLTNAFVTITASQQTGAGDSVGGGNQNFNLWTASVKFDSTSQITISTPNASADTWVAIEIIEYIGAASAANEFIVRAQGEVTFGSTSTTADVTGFTLTDINDGVLWLTGWENPSANRSSSEGSRVSGSFPNATTGRWTRNATDAGAITVSYAVIEFTGSNWKIQRKEHNYTAAGTNETESITAVNDLAHTFIHVQKRITSGDRGLDEHGHEVYLSSTSQLTFQIESGATTPSGHYSVVWVIENTQSDSGAMNVARYSGTQAGGSEPQDTSFGITAVADTAQTSLSGNCRVTGNGTAYPRPQIAFYLNATNQVGMWISDTGQTRTYRVEVIEWPTVLTTIDISGTVYTNEAKTLNIGANKTVALSVNGAAVQTDETDASGQFSFTAVEVDPNDVLLLYLDDETEDGSLATITDSVTDLTGGNALEMYTGKVVLEYQTGTEITNTNLDVIDGVDAQNEDGITIASGNATFVDGQEVWVDSGMTYNPGGTVEADDFEINGTATFSPAANGVTISGDCTISATGTFTSSGTVTFDGSSKQILSTGGTDASHDFQNITHAGSAELELDPTYDLNVDGTFTQSGTGDFDTQAKTLTINALTVSNGTFNTDARAGTWNIGSGALTISGGTLTATSGTFNVTGSFSNSGTFTHNSATLTFNATGGTPSISAPPANGAFNNVTINASGITYTLSSAIDIDGALDVTAGTLNANGNTINIGGDWSVHASNGVFTSGANTVDFDGSSLQILTPGGTDVNHDFQNLTHSGSAVLQLALGSDLDVDGTLLQSGLGDFDTQAQAITCGTLSVSDGTFNTSADSGTWTVGTGGVSITGGTLTATSGTFNIAGGFSNSGTFTHNSATLTFNATSGSPSINAPAANGAINNITFDDGGNNITFSLASAIDIDNNLTITGGTLNAAGYTIHIGGNWDNNDIFTHGDNQVVFDASSTGKTIEAGASSFYDIEFNNASGGWTIQTNDLTTANDFTITACSATNGFVVEANRTITVNGTFTNSVGGANTTWNTGTTLNLTKTGGGSYTLNAKTDSGDTYVTLQVGADTDIRMWNSSASTYSVNATGSLYSMDHSATDGDLYIWGDYYVPASATDYWSYATDFDGTDLSGGSERQVDVQFSSGANVTCGAGETLEIKGISGNITAVTRQSTGTYGIDITNGTIDAEYYSIDYIDGSGLNISGSSAVVTNLSNGDFDNSGGSGSSDTFLTVAGVSLDNNPALTISNVNFDNTGSAAEYNVTATGTSSSFWDFDASTGTFDGEANDSDPGGDPGYLVWDDSSSASITVSGTAYTDDDELTTITDGTTVSLKVNGTGTYSDTTSSGNFSISGVSVDAGDTLTVYFDENGPPFASCVTVTDGTNITNLRLYQDHVIIGHNTTASVTISQMALWDSSDDSDIKFTAVDSTTDTLVIDDNHELYIPTNFTFQPLGNLESGTNGVYDVEIIGTFTCSGSEIIRVSGSFINSGTFTVVNSNLKFDGTSGSHTINTGGATLYDTSVIGAATYTLAAGMSVDNSISISAGTLNTSTYTLTVNPTLTINGGTLTATNGNIDANSDVTISSGTLNAPSSGNSFTIAGNYANIGGNFVSSTGKVTFDKGSGTQTVNAGGTGNNNKDFNDLTKSGGGTLQLIASGLEVDGTLLVSLATEFELNGQNLNITGTLDNKGIVKMLGSEPTVDITNMDTAEGEVVYVGDGDGTPEAHTIKDFGASLDYYDLTINDTNPTKDSFQTVSNLNVNGTLDVLSGTLDISANANTLTVAGATTINGGVLTATNGNIDANSDFTFTSGTMTAPDSTQYFNVSGSLDLGGTFNNSNGTIKFDATSGGPYTIDSGGNDLYDLEIDDGAGSVTYTLGGAVILENDLTITDGTLNTGSNHAITLGGNWSNAGIFISNSSLVTFNASGTQTIDAGGTGNDNTDFYNLTKSGTGTLQLINTGLEVDGTLTLSSGLLLDLNGQDLTVATLDNQGTVELHGNETVDITTMDTLEGTVRFVGDGDITQDTHNIAGFGSGATSEFYALIINDTTSPNPKDIFQTTEDVHVYNTFEIDGGTLSAGSYNFDCDSNFTVTSGTVTAPGTGKTLTLGDDFIVAGTFSANSGDVTFDNASNAATINAPAGGLTFYDLTCNTASKVLNFTAGDTFTVSNTFTLNGQATGTRIDLNSTSPATVWNLILNGTHAVSYVDVQDSNASGAASLPIDPDGSYNSGNNTNWFSVGDAADPNALRSSQDRHTFYDGTNYWAFYIDANSDVVYKKSPDGIEWPSAPDQVVAAGTYESLGIWEDGTDIFCSYTDGASLLVKKIPISTGTPGTEYTIVEDFAMEWGTVSSVTSTFTTVNLINDYGSSMVAKASPGYTETDDPTVTRMQNASNTSFDVRVQNAGGTGPTTQTVYYLVTKTTSSGTQIPGTSYYIEAQTYTSTVTDENNSWAGQQQTYQNTYSNPTAVGQVMTQNDTQWSTFWSNGDGSTSPITNTTIYTGKHVAEDTTVTRNNETVGFIVAENNIGTLNGIKYEIGSATGFDRIFDNSGTTGNFTQTFSAAPATGVIDNTGQGGANGAWALWYGTTPFTSTQFTGGVDEDTIGDTERTGNADQVHYYVFETSGGYYGADINHPQVIKDSSNYLWVKWENSVNDTFIVRSTNTADESAWNAHYTTKTSTDSTDYGHSQIVPLASGQIMYIYQDGNTLYSKTFSDPTSQGSATQIVTDCESGTSAAWDDSHYFSVVSDVSGSNYLVYLIYVDSVTGYIEYTNYDSSAGTWDTPVSVSNSGSCSTPALFYDTQYGTIYAFWLNSSSVKYKRLEGPTWPSSETTLESSLDSPALLSCAYSDGANIGLMWKEGTTSEHIEYGNVAITATIVSLSELYALGLDSSVKVIWKTESEIDNEGFNIYRSQDPVNGYTQVNPTLIAGLGTSLTGGSYQYIDAGVTGGLEYYYILESVEYGGKKRKYGPVVAHPGKDTDSDGISDDFEYFYGLDPAVNDAGLDPDNDSLTNLQEYNNGSDPYSTPDALLSWTASSSGAPGVTVISTTDDTITLELITNEFDTEDKTVGVDTYQVVSFPEYGHSYNEDEGKPMVPLKGVLVSMVDKVPENIEILEYDKETLAGYNIYPVPQKVLTLDGGAAYLTTQFFKDTNTYSQDSFYPNALARLDYSTALRDQEVAKVKFYPLQFNPVTGAVELYNRLRVRLTTREAGAASTQATGGSGNPENATAFKIHVNEDGIYRITQSALSVAGMDVASVNPKNFKLYFEGREIPIYVEGENDQSFDASDYIEFYGMRHTQDRYSYTNVYWLTFDADPGARIQAKTSSAGTTPSTFFSTHHDESNWIYWSEFRGASDPWYLDFVKAGQDTSFSVDLDDVVNSTNDGLFTIQLRGFNTYSYNEDLTYHARLYINDYLIGDDTWSGMDDHTISVEIPSYWLIDGTNTIKLEHILDDAAYPNIWIFIDWTDISYWRQFRAVSDYLKITPQGVGNYTYVVTNFNDPNIKVYDVTEHDNIQHISDAVVAVDGVNFKVTFNDATPVNAVYAVCSDASVKSASSIVADAASSLRDTSNQADYIIVTSDAYYDQILPLATHREAQGLNVTVAKLTDVYDEFNYGRSSPYAIKYFLQYAYNNWMRPAPVYVLLVGDATFDYRDDEGEGFADYLPTYLVFNEDFGETATDNWFVCFDGQSDIFPDMLIGRFPVHTQAQATDMVNKTIDYEGVALTADWVDDIVYVADDEATFEAMSNALSEPTTITDAYIPTKIYLSSYATGAECRSAIVNRINQGALMVNYSGHGGIEIWADEQILRKADVSSLTNTNKYPFMVMLNCVNGLFMNPVWYDFECLAEELVRAHDAGAVCTLAPSGVSLPDHQRILAQGLYDSIFKEKERIVGSAVANAKMYLYQETESSAQEILQTFNLFGDPALILRKEATTTPTEPTEPTVYSFASATPTSFFALDFSNDAAKVYPSILFETPTETPQVSDSSGQPSEVVRKGVARVDRLTPMVKRLAQSSGVTIKEKERIQEKVMARKNKIIALGPVEKEKEIVEKVPQEAIQEEPLLKRPEPEKEMDFLSRIKDFFKRIIERLFRK